MRDLRTGTLVWIAGSATVASLAASSLLFLARDDDAAPSPPNPVPSAAGSTNVTPLEATQLQPFRVDVDLRQRASTGALTLSLPRRRLHAAIVLPESSGPGDYEIQLVDSSGQPRASVVGQAVFRSGLPTLQITLDLSSVPRASMCFPFVGQAKPGGHLRQK